MVPTNVLISNLIGSILVKKKKIMDWFRLILALVIMLVVIAFGSFIIGLVWYLLWLVAWWLFPVLVGLLLWWMIYKVLLEKKK